MRNCLDFRRPYTNIRVNHCAQRGFGPNSIRWLNRKKDGSEG
jgi:hypothetical protein